MIFRTRVIIWIKKIIKNHRAVSTFFDKKQSCAEYGDLAYIKIQYIEYGQQLYTMRIGTAYGSSEGTAC